MRSLRRVLLPLVLLSGLAFRGVRFDDAAAAPGPLLLPFPLPPQQPAPPLALPAGGGREDESDSTEIVAVPPPLPPRELLVRPPRRQSVPANAVTEETEPGVRSELQFYDNGTIQLVDRLSQAPLWQFSTGPPISKHITTTNSDLSYLIYPMDESDLVEVHNGTGVKLPWEMEEFIARTPYIRDSVVTIGSKASTIFAVDADSGEIIYKHSLPAALNESGESPVEEAPSKLDAGRSPNIIVVVRTDYSLSASDLGVHLFNWTRTSFSANYYVKHSHSDMLEQSSCLRGNIPCIRTNGVPLKLTLPDSSTANALVLLDVNKVTTRDDADALKLLGTLVNSRQAGSKSGVVLDGTQNRTVGGALGHLVSAHPQTNRSTYNAYGFLFPVLSLLVLLAWLVRWAYSSKSCRQFISLLMKPFVREKKSIDLRGKSEVASKRRKTRKKDGTSNSTEIGSASDKESSETGGSNETPYALPYGLDGCQIGKLRVHKKEIGKGSNGTVVFEGSYDGREVAVKRLLLSHTDIAQKEIENLIASDRDPNIVRLYGCDQDDNFVYISLERCRCSLADLIQQHTDPPLSDVERIDVELWTQDGLPSVQLLKLMRDVVAGLVHLHSLGIIHRDLKPQNVLIRKDLSVRSFQIWVSVSACKRIWLLLAIMALVRFGSSGWQAPEQLRHESQTRAMDLFSLGCLIFYCITKGKHPFGEYYERDMNIIKGNFDLFVVDHIPEAVHLISQLLQPKPEDRPTTVYAINHPLFWSPELRLLFLRDSSDRVEKTTETDLLNALESIGHEAFGGKWREKLDDGLVADMGRYRKYNFESTPDLLRLIRNKSGHYRELSADLKELLGSLPEGFDRYFSSRFTKLLIEVYKVMYVHCKDEEAFRKYFIGSSV